MRGIVIIIAAATLSACGASRRAETIIVPDHAVEHPAARVAVDQPATYFDFQVDSRAAPQAGNSAPAFPAGLRAERVEGEVLAQFVVDETGRVVGPSLKILHSSHPDFTVSVIRTVPNWKFTAATKGGVAVRQLVQMPIRFQIAQ